MAPPSRNVQNIVEIMKNIGEEERYFFNLKIKLSLSYSLSWRSDLLEPFKIKARWIPRAMGPFLDLSNIFYAGIPTDEDE